MPRPMTRPAPPLDALLDPIARRLTGTAPEPDPAPDPETLLAQIAELSRNARATWFGLIGLCLFVGVTLLGHRDADFFAYGAETQLPLINVQIPVWSFFFFAPVLVAALYIYLHLYLMSLWDALADAPPLIGRQPLADAVFPWLISQAALWYRNRVRPGTNGEPPEGCAAPRSLGRLVVATSVTLGWLFGLIILGGLWVRSMPAHDEWLTLWIALWFWAAAIVGYTGFRAACARMAGAPRDQVANSRESRRWLTGALAALLGFLSWETTEGGLQTTTPEGLPPFLYPANLVEAELTRKPPGWLPWHLWREDFEEKYRKRKGIAPGPELTDEQKPAFEKEANERYAEYIAQLDAPNLQDADLRNASMSDIFLSGADLRGARLRGSKLDGADLQGADFSCRPVNEYSCLPTDVRNVDFLEARLQGSDFSAAKLDESDFTRAQVQEAEFVNAEMRGVSLRNATMHRANLLSVSLRKADLLGALMHNASLAGAKMQGADLRWAQMNEAKLHGAQMQGAYLRGAKLQRANLREARMQGANLREAQMQDSDCSSVTLRGALLQYAMITCKVSTLTQEQLDLAVGDSRTVLPDGLTVASCLPALPQDVEAALAHHPEQGSWGVPSRAEIGDALRCPEGVKPVRLDYDPFERRFWDR